MDIYMFLCISIFGKIIGSATNEGNDRNETNTEQRLNLV